MKNNDIIEIMDGVGDVAFVAIGVLWKMGFNSSDINLLGAYANGSREYDDEIGELLKKIDTDHGAPGICIFNLISCLLTSTLALALHRVNMEPEFWLILEAICDSNDTKAIKGKVAADVKANVDKGVNFVHPKEALLKLYNTKNNPTGVVN